MHKRSVIVIMPGVERIVQATYFNSTTESIQKKAPECIVTYVLSGRVVAFQRTVDAGWCFSAVINK